MIQVVVVQVAAAAVDVTNKFITTSEASNQAKKTASLLKTLHVNAIINGEHGVGKTALAAFILPDAFIIDASNFDELLTSLESSNEIIIKNIDKSPNLLRLINAIVNNNVRVIATSCEILSSDYIDEIFSIKIDIPPLRERPEDINTLLKVFTDEARSLFGSQKEVFTFEDLEPDLSQNSYSLRRQVMINFLLQDIKDTDLMELTEKYLYNRLGTSNDYKNFLYLYEVPLIKTGLKKFKSQLQLSDKLGLNRNTLRKKISDNQKYLTKEI
ncbi:Fis family transcriptional regulator [Sulfurimonas sp.]|uniref:Fis family transcriptional regulator n=1 Tax=Sulfurimonas sp. TaxID=2022749 RepID=UPI002627A828|nr:Fis family transcriptional regulator [Sulfurimonas sp.]